MLHREAGKEEFKTTLLAAPKINCWSLPIQRANCQGVKKVIFYYRGELLLISQNITKVFKNIVPHIKSIGSLVVA